jgi:hypothetical protein
LLFVDVDDLEPAGTGELRDLRALVLDGLGADRFADTEVDGGAWGWLH